MSSVVQKPHPITLNLSPITFNLSPLTFHLSPFKKMENKNIWSKILNIVITVLTAIATTFGVTSCMGV